MFWQLVSVSLVNGIVGSERRFRGFRQKRLVIGYSKRHLKDGSIINHSITMASLRALIEVLNSVLLMK